MTRAEYIEECVKLESVPLYPVSDYWVKRLRIADIYIYDLEDRIKELEKIVSKKDTKEK